MNGIATLDLVITSDITIYCVFNGTSDYNECTSNNVTIIKKSYLFYDTCNSATGLVNYDNSILIRGSNASCTLSYDTVENAYTIIGSGNYHSGIPIITTK